MKDLNCQLSDEYLEFIEKKDRYTKDKKLQ